MKKALQVLYSCVHCGAKDRVVTVAERGAEEDVVRWVEDVVMVAVARDHSQRSPFCGACELTQLKIPVTGVERIGDVPKEPVKEV